MKKIFVASAALMLICGPALAHTTRHHHRMTNGNMHRGSMGMGTTGMGHGGQRGYVRPDASGQGGSGPGSDQGGTRVAPGSMK